MSLPKNTASVQVKDQSFLFYNENNRLALFTSKSISESDDDDYQQVSIRRDGAPFEVDPNTPISAVSWDDGNVVQVRVYYTKKGLIEELAWDTGKQSWYSGKLTNKKWPLADGSGISASVQKGWLKVYTTTTAHPYAFTVFYIVIGQHDWSSRPIRG